MISVFCTAYLIVGEINIAAYPARSSDNRINTGSDKFSPRSSITCKNFLKREQHISKPYKRHQQPFCICSNNLEKAEHNSLWTRDLLRHVSKFVTTCACLRGCYPRKCNLPQSVTACGFSQDVPGLFSSIIVRMFRIRHQTLNWGFDL